MANPNIVNVTSIYGGNASWNLSATTTSVLLTVSADVLVKVNTILCANVDGTNDATLNLYIDGLTTSGITGVAGTSALGSVTAAIGINPEVTGLVGTSALGSVLAGTSATISAVGVVSTGSVGVPLVWGDIDTSQVPNWQVVNSS